MKAFTIVLYGVNIGAAQSYAEYLPSARFERAEGWI